MRNFKNESKEHQPAPSPRQADGAFGGLNLAFFAGNESAADTDCSAILTAEPRRHLHTSNKSDLRNSASRFTQLVKFCITADAAIFGNMQ